MFLESVVFIVVPAETCAITSVRDINSNKSTLKNNIVKNL